MNRNRLSVLINCSIDKVFEFTTNPECTPLWLETIQEEISTEYPPKVGTQYKNRSKNTPWDFYKVVLINPNKEFELADLEGNYHVNYRYSLKQGNLTELVYFEWMNNGELKNPFSMSPLLKLKEILEAK